MGGHQGFGLGASEGLVGDHGVAGDRDAVEQLGSDDPFAEELPVVGQPSNRQPSNR